ncbi:LysR family transcriptional regulator [Virgibacillus halodenitrificans]|uniref:LysR family transcriptional regulator n=1 Tax=Virgibacillus halodenitrificans TaxID=1482 RepID=A0ABR7VGR9_VIRHA|nr:LysR family transcriptional regulator [Virgibacillus halodenitrificans]MBD1221143.1 LysR family transcriptional regulator [Virgibacillus halodenitrificans]MCG1027222.1 LysR family transcriptional regulator [Virgibacillus halodenitrificans]MYL57357.1 LysR family transcriptional regulator [Virgibacillus halodenitrificans]
MSLQTIRYFIEVAKYLSFSEASKSLHISQPGLSQQISELENKLGFKLLNRTTRKVTLTEEGSYIFNKLASSFDEIEKTVDFMSSRKMIPKAQIKIATVPSAASIFIPKLLIKVSANFPDVDLYTHETSSAKAIELMKKNNFHLAFIRTPIYKEEYLTTNLSLFEFKKYPLRLIVSKDHPLAKKDSIDLYEARNDTFIHYSDEQTNPLQFLLEKACLTAGFSPKKLCTGSALLSISNLVANNLGVSLMPSDMAGLLESNKLKTIKLHNMELYSSSSVLWNKDSNSPFLTEQILEILKTDPIFQAFIP